jgi:hypothetical protein
MKSTLCLLAAASLLAVAGCKKSGSSPAANDAANAAAAAHLDPSLTDEQKAGAIMLNKLIQSFSAKEHRNPDNLQELVSKGYMRGLPPAPAGMKFDYDPAKGEVQVVKQ